MDRLKDSGNPDPVRSRIAHISQIRGEVIAEVEKVSQKEGAARLRPGEWNLQEIVEHLVLADSVLFNVIWDTAERFRDGEPVWTGGSCNAGLPVEEIIDRTWKEKEQAPAGARPSGRWSLSLWTLHLQRGDSLFERLIPHLGSLPLREVIHPHYLSGPMDLLQWLDFVRFHLERHLKQIRRMKAESGTSSPADEPV